MNGLLTGDEAVERLRAIAVVIERYGDVMTAPLAERIATDLRAIANALKGTADAILNTQQGQATGQ